MFFRIYFSLCLNRRGVNGKNFYLSPEDPAAKETVLIRLLSRYEAWDGRSYAGEPNYGFEVLDTQSLLLKPVYPAKIG